MEPDRSPSIRSSRIRAIPLKDLNRGGEKGVGALSNNAIGNESLLLVPVHAPLCKIENNSQSENDCQRGSNSRHRRPPYG